jgi:gamma-glutamylcyclotransferase (GGCT)/AIG2-like uncharacterized protein YtfP
MKTTSTAAVADERLLVYGTLVDPAERRRLLGRAIDADDARLDGYARGRRRHYFIVAAADGFVAGKILRGLDERDFAILDEYEDVPRLYTRERVTAIDREGRALECWVYLPTGWERSAR